LAKLAHLDEWTAARQRNAQTYDRLFREAGLATSDGSPAQVILPTVVTNRHIFNQYVIRVERRNELQAELKRRGVATEVYYPVPLHLQECFAGLGYRKGDLPESEAAAETTLALPVHPELTGEQVRYVVNAIGEYVLSNAPSGASSN
jgi:dTDP-4-amino-4,6-dideoxygalactose transaminase